MSMRSCRGIAWQTLLLSLWALLSCKARQSCEEVQMHSLPFVTALCHLSRPSGVSPQHAPLGGEGLHEAYVVSEQAGRLTSYSMIQHSPCAPMRPLPSGGD